MHRIGPTTARLAMRAFEPRDAELFARLRSDPEITRYTGDAETVTAQQAVSMIEAYPDFEAVGFGRWGLFLRETGEGIGFCGLKYLEELDQVDLGYRLIPEHWGHGYATEASLACMEFGFSVLALEEIIGLVEKENVGSVRVLEKVGMKYVDDVEYWGSVVARYGRKK